MLVSGSEQTSAVIGQAAAVAQIPLVQTKKPI